MRCHSCELGSTRGEGKREMNWCALALYGAYLMSMESGACNVARELPVTRMSNGKCIRTMDEVRSCGIAISFTCGCDERGLGHHQTIRLVLLSTK